ncbi:MAG: permease-like cell division protein FtsX [candidate division WOR-3 bacterium]
MTVFLIITFALSVLLNVIAKRGEIYAFVTDAAAADCISIVSQASMLEGVQEVRFVTKDEALAELRTDLGDDVDLLNAIDSNPLPASLRLTLGPGLSSFEQLANLEQKLRLLPGVTEVWSSKDAIMQLARAVRTASFVDGVVLLITVVSSIFIVFQAVDSSVSSHRQEIEIMELVGASPLTVRLPFILQGTAQGICGGLIAFLILIVIYIITRSSVPIPEIPMIQTFALDVSLGLTFGFVGSIFALRRRV